MTWKLLLGAAVAGYTGFLAKHFFNSCSNQTPICRDDQDPDQGNGHTDCFDAMKCSSFSSSGPTGITVFRRGRRNLGKKGEKRFAGAVVCRRRFAVCLGRRRTAKNAAYKCVSRFSRDNTVFSWGVGAGIIMYMMSAWKAEISKLNSAINETAKIVQELRTELCKRKSSHNLVASNPSNVVATSSKKVISQHTQLVLDKLGMANQVPDENISFGLPAIDDGECASSVLTEEPEEQGPEDKEMTQLEAELVVELQKLSETEISAERLNQAREEGSDTYPYIGVLPSELDRKLCHLLIEEQGSQIVELESELHLAQSKLHDKDAELQALKHCIRNLTSMSLSTISDDEAEVQEEQVGANEWGQNQGNNRLG